MGTKTIFEEMKKTWPEKRALLKCYARSCRGEIVESKTGDGWDIMLQLISMNLPNSQKGVIYTSVGPTYPEVYDELLSMVMSSHGWKTVEEMKVWIDLRSIA